MHKAAATMIWIISDWIIARMKMAISVPIKVLVECIFIF